MDDDACPMCAGVGVQLGTLGLLTHYRCRSCGSTYSIPCGAQYSRYVESETTHGEESE